MEPAEYGVMFGVEDDYWWYLGLHRLLLRWIEGFAAGRRLRILDAGCGTGRLLELLAGQAFVQQALGIELAAEAFRFLASRGLRTAARGSVEALPYPDACFDVVVSADVLCCIGAPDDAVALAELARVLAPGGLLLLHLPAFAALHGEHDRAVAVRRRYRRPELATMLATAGLDVDRLTYRVAALLPLAAPARWLTRFGASRRPAARSDLRRLPVLLNRLLAAVQGTENAWVRTGIDLPCGLSVLAAATKRD